MIKLNGFEIDFKEFPNGESFADIPESIIPYEGDVIRDSFTGDYIYKSGYNKIHLKFENDKDIFHLMCIKDYVDTKWGNLPCILEMPYIPYSRMDRQEEKRLFTLKTFANLINSMNFTYVKVMEPHSEVSVALIDRVKVENKSADLALKAMRDILGLQGSCWLQDSLYGDIHMNKADMFKQAREVGIYFVYPDAGAEKRYRKQIKYDKVLTCSKDRDFNTGRINSIEINGADKVDDCKIAIIVDDLSSRGGTFIGSAQALRKAFPNIEEIVLCVTHCENTIYDGEVLTGTDITKVFTTNSILRVPGYNEETNFDKNKLIIENIR